MSDGLSMNDPDAHIRAAAFTAMEKLVIQPADGFVPWDEIRKGFQVGTEHILLLTNLGVFSNPDRCPQHLASKRRFRVKDVQHGTVIKDLASSKLDYATGLLD